MLPQNKYNYIEENMPVVTVDLLILKKNKILLCKRNNEPLKNIYYTPGGRIYKNETARQSIKRKINEELGISLKEVKEPYGFIEEFFNYSGKLRHNINILFYCELESDCDINFNLNTEHSDIKWVDINEKNIHNYVKVKIQKYLNNKDIRFNCVL